MQEFFFSMPWHPTWWDRKPARLWAKLFSIEESGNHGQAWILTPQVAWPGFATLLMVTLISVPALGPSSGTGLRKPEFQS